MELSQGSRLANRFKVVGSLGQGTFGPTFLAADSGRGEALVVLKALPSSLSSEARQRLRQRVALGKAVQSPQIARVLDLVDDPEFLAISYEYIKGQPCDEILRSNNLEFSWFIEALDVVAQAFKVLQQHSFSGSLPKPSNVIRSEQGSFLLTDWLLPVTSMNPEKSGAAAYQAPEIAEGGPNSILGDIYALGTLAQDLRRAIFSWPSQDMAEASFRFIDNCREPELHKRYQDFDIVRQELGWLAERATTRLICGAGTFLVFMFVYVSLAVVVFSKFL